MSKKYVVFDFETTGLSPLNAQVVEIGAIKFENEKRIGEFEVILKPTVKVEPKAIEAHKLTDEFLAKNGKDPSREWKKFSEFIEDFDLIAHNGLGFDFQFLFNAFASHKINVLDNQLIDTLPLSKGQLKTKTGFYKLEHLCDSYKIKNEQPHRAMGDVTALVKLLSLLEKKLPTLTEMWNSSGRFTLGGLGELPKGFELMQKAIEQGLDIEIDYEGVDKPRRTRWLSPLRVEYSRGHRYVVGVCPDTGKDKHFRTDRFFGVLQTRKRGKQG